MKKRYVITLVLFFMVNGMQFIFVNDMDIGATKTCMRLIGVLFNFAVYAYCMMNIGKLTDK